MTFISYAQNYEDVMLWRALKHVKNGFYIDVGANDPTIDSVTKAFYERGWSGINVEPLPSHYEDLVKARPRDINILAAVGASEGVVDLWECEVRGWATVSVDVAKHHEAEGHPGVLHKVPLTTLTTICEKFADAEIHFLKIDVEGFEKAVINGMDFHRFRPWLLVVESTVPNSTQENHVSWEHVVLEAGYKVAYCDGLNRFYMAEEHAYELQPSLKYPPNVFDDFKLANQLEVETKAQQAEAKAQQAEAKAQQAEAKAQQAEASSQQYFLQIQAMYNSKSWRITKPLRHTKLVLRALVGKVLRLVVRKAKAVVNRFPVAKRLAIWILYRSSFLMRLVTRFADNKFNSPLDSKKRIYKFDQLGAVRIMIALSSLPSINNENTVTFLEVSDDVR